MTELFVRPMKPLNRIWKFFVETSLSLWYWKYISSSWKIVVSIFQMLRFSGMFPGSYRCVYLIDPLFIAYCAEIFWVDKLKRLKQMIEDDSKNIRSTDIACHIQWVFYVSSKLLKTSDNKVCARWQLDIYIYRKIPKCRKIANLRWQI